jgi:hypothetical protein
MHFPIPGLGGFPQSQTTAFAPFSQTAFADADFREATQSPQSCDRFLLARLVLDSALSLQTGLVSAQSRGLLKTTSLNPIASRLFTKRHTNSSIRFHTAPGRFSQGIPYAPPLSCTFVVLLWCHSCDANRMVHTELKSAGIIPDVLPAEVCPTFFVWAFCVCSGFLSPLFATDLEFEWRHSHV